MKLSKLYSIFQSCLLVVVLLMTINLALSTTIIVDLTELEEEVGEWLEEVDNQADYEFDDNDETPNNYSFPTAYWTPSRLFSFTRQDNSNTTGINTATINFHVFTKLYLRFQQLQLDY